MTGSAIHLLCSVGMCDVKSWCQAAAAWAEGGKLQARGTAWHAPPPQAGRCCQILENSFPSMTHTGSCTLCASFLVKAAQHLLVDHLQGVMLGILLAFTDGFRKLLNFFYLTFHSFA